MSRKRRPLGFVLFLLLLLVLLRIPPPPAQAARSPLVLAFYYAWFDDNSWKPGQMPDQPLVRYSSRDPQAIARQIQQARGAGIDAFVVSWLGAGNPTDDNFKTMLAQARGANFAAAVDFEVTSPFYHSREDVVKSLKYLLSTHTSQPGYLRVGGKPVIFFWREQKYSVDTWKAIRDAVDPNRQSLWIAEGVDVSYLRVFDGHHLYSIGWSPNPTAEMEKWGKRVRAFGQDKIWVATVMPGNDDTRTGRAGAYVRSRRNGDFYRETWRAALASHPDWIIITSWNEWVEYTSIEPSVSYGDLYLNITRENAARFKGALPAPAAVPVSSRPAAPTRTPIAGGIRAATTDVLRVRTGPSTVAPILGRLAEGAALTLLGRSADGNWWQIAYPDTKKRGWVAAEYVKLDVPANKLPIVGGIQASGVASASRRLTPTPAPDPIIEYNGPVDSAAPEP
ncbi:MAG: SH3 domain-containing protein [Chloroflexi bacterium]|nr:SH3 domain-containing protein [Chloroflexota bacterium]